MKSFEEKARIWLCNHSTEKNLLMTTAKLQSLTTLLEEQDQETRRLCAAAVNNIGVLVFESSEEA